MADGITDFTDRVIEFLKTRMVGHDVQQSLKTIEDHTETVLGVTGGWELKARGSAEVTSLQSHTGSLKRVEFGSFTIWVTEPHLKLVVRYKGNTNAEKRSVPGGAIFDRPWVNSKPKGTYTAILKMEAATNAVLAIENDIDEDHNDRPGRFIRDHVARKFQAKIDNLLEEFTGKDIN